MFGNNRRSANASVGDPPTLKQRQSAEYDLEPLAQQLLERLEVFRPIAFLDLESTGLDTARDRIVEVSVVRITPTGEVATFSTLVNPELQIAADATAVHGIDDDAVADAPTFSGIAAELTQFLDGCDLAGYNLRRFDLPLLRAEMRRCGVPIDIESPEIIDSCMIFKFKERRDLAAAVSFYSDGGHMPAHEAMADVIATMAVLDGQLRRYDDLPRTPAGLHELLLDPNRLDHLARFVWKGSEAVFGFGKYAGESLRLVAKEHPDYLQWMLKGDFAADVLDIVSDAISGRFPLRTGPIS